MLVTMGARRVRWFVATGAVWVPAFLCALVGVAPRAVADSSANLLVYPLRSGAGQIELRVQERSARYELVVRDAISPRRDLGLLTYQPMDGKAVDRNHDVANRWQIRGYAVDAASGRRVPVLIRVDGPLLIPTLSDYFRTLQATNQQLLSKEDASRLFGMTLNSFKQTGLIPIYEKFNPR